MEVTFTSDILKLECKIGPTQDQVGRINLEFSPDDETFLMLKKLYKPDTQVMVTIRGEE